MSRIPATFTYLVMLVGVAAVLMAFSPIGPVPSCTATGFNADLTLICNSGTCNPGTCAVQTVTDGASKKLYDYCGCGADTEPDCCHLISRYTGTPSAPRAKDVNGTCPPCPLNGTCRLHNDQPDCYVEPH